MINTDPWIETFTGRRFYFLHPSPEDICIEDIAHALSMICRFTGHTTNFYSVAQHSLLVSRWVSKNYALVGLMHDAQEAYLGDISHPLKKILPDYRHIEEEIASAIRQKFNLPMVGWIETSRVDREVCYAEARALMPNVGDWAGTDVSLIWSRTPRDAERDFLEEYRRLTR